jgi:hypothetical protein
MRTVLSLDVGVTSGFAVLDAEHTDIPIAEQIVAHGAVTLRDLEFEIKRILTSYIPRWVVVESPIIIRGPLGDQLRSATAIVEETLRPTGWTYWTPSRWKPHPLAKTPLPWGLTPHERDAIRLGLVYRAQVVEKLLENL